MRPVPGKPSGSFNAHLVCYKVQVSARKEFTEQKFINILSRASMLMVAVVMFSAFSCLFTLSLQNMADAKAQTISVLSYLANHLSSLSGTKI